MNFKSILDRYLCNASVQLSVFMELIMPYGIVMGYLTVVLAFQLAKVGIPLEKISPLIALSIFPNIIKFLWAPLIDATLTCKKWYILSNTITALGVFFIGLLPVKEGSLTLMGILVFLMSFASTFSVMATCSLMAYNTPKKLIGYAGGWMNAGYFVGVAIGGGIGLWFADKIGNTFTLSIVIATICLLCNHGLIQLLEPQHCFREKKIEKTFRNLFNDIREVIKSRTGFFALLLCVLPIGSGAASNLWSAISGDWGASARVVALTIGIAGSLFSAIGSLIGGWICDKIDRKKAYVFFGMLQATFAVLMAFAPRTELMFILGTAFYSISTGLLYSGFSSLILEVVGKDAVATKYNMFISLSFIPIYLMIYIDEWAYKKCDAFGLLIIEAVIGFICMLLFFTVFRIFQQNSQDNS
jgi:MFS transporter, PAT family, beta-lactamase induction signal transducer AmpG